MADPAQPFSSGDGPAEHVGRRSDMDPSMALRMLRQEDGDFIVSIGPADARFHEAAVEFCSGPGGGSSPRTMAALRALWAAMVEDNEDRPAGNGARRRGPTAAAAPASSPGALSDVL